MPSRLASLLGLKAAAKDIELPNESGRVDPRLKPEPQPDAASAFGRAYEGYKILKEKGLLDKSKPQK